jgi:peptidyl-prolyl cis-trans isomerase C
MNAYARYLVFTLVLFSLPLQAADNIVEDGDVGMTRAEVEFLATKWAPAMQQAAANDAGERIELLNNEMVNIKVANLADTIPVDPDSELYWTYVHAIRLSKQRYVLAHFIDNLDVPDMTALAEERYNTEKDKYALVTEHRLASHILVLCRPGQCNRIEKRKIAEQVLAELKAGADWNEMVLEYSDDPGSKSKNGLFEQWLVLGIPKVDPHFVGGVFSIEKEGEYSEVVDTQFGLHIIRLDKVQPSFYRSFAEVKDTIVAALEAEYRKLAVKEYNAQLNMSNQVTMDSDALDEIFAPYRRRDPSQEPVSEQSDASRPDGAPSEVADGVLGTADDEAQSEVQQAMDAAKEQIKAATGQ